MEIKHYFRIIRKRLWLILTCVLVATATSAYYSYTFIQPIYQASTQIIINNTVGQVGNEQIDFNTLGTNLMLIETYKEIIRTPAIMDKVVEAAPELGLTSQMLGQMVQVTNANNSQVMTLTVYDLSYARAATIVNTVTQVFQAQISSIMKVDNVHILNEAYLDDVPPPVNQSVNQNIMLSFGIALVFAVALAFLLEYLDDTLKTEEDIRRVFGGVRTFGTVGRIRAKDMRAGHRAKSLKQTGGSTYAANSR
ncbi:lipopolysaccharide biosynthesis protein [Paenibacillus sp. IB182496]|uniref:Lipopolysaccharide biosynthesis protein n=1 Tax=Paenibacillus sabuli TaxID=2772509 RepID=A0A927GUY2_9BACL|nr:Wzz/FepE/Etk N-terminal domain-containing protein [Paenibacillus sabuli]MBD2848640.1 lipopolysaccharide biosynthesis protein [Paenibacillus sabuli]